LDIEQVFNWNASLDKQIKKLDLSTQIYVNYFQNYIYLAPTGETQLTIRGAFPVYEFKQIEASIVGWDFNGAYKINSQFDFDFGTSILRGNDLSNNKFLWGMPSDEFNTALIYQPKFKRLLNNTTLEVNYSYVNSQFRFNSEDDFVDPPVGYSLLNFKAYTKLNFKTPLTLYCNVNNVLNTSYRNYLNRFRYFTDEMGRNVVFGLKYNFEINEQHHHHK